jgi:luciferase family oxidoreductase group 1
MASAENFPQDVLELQAYFRAAEPGQPVRAVPGEGLEVPIWLLGSSLFSAQLAAQLGLPFAFAAHFAPELMMQAITIYRQNFRPSETLAEPCVMIGIGVYAADTDAEARRLMTPSEQQVLLLRRGKPGKLQPPVDDISLVATPAEVASLAARTLSTVAGTADRISAWLRDFIARTGADELIAMSQIYDHQARLHSYALLAEARDRVQADSTKG